MTIQTSGDDCRESGEGETSRRAFEDWAINQCRFDLRYSDQARKIYASMKTRDAWIVWQASRAAIEIHLPGQFRESYQSSNMVMDAEAVKERLADAGINFME